MNGRRARAFRAYQKIKTLKPARSLFDLSHEVLMTCDMFKLYPCCIMEMSPGDTFHMWNQSVTRMQPLNAPIMSEIWQSTHYFFVPYRILWNLWTDFITGGKDGEYGGDTRGDSEPSEVTPELPRWEPTNTAEGSLWDYCGFPTGVKPKGAYPLAFVKYAYNRIWNEYYRDENLQDEIDEDNEEILYRDWKKDYFTSALLSQQRGVSPSLPVTGTVQLHDTNSSVVSLQNNGTFGEVNFSYSEATWDPSEARLNVLYALSGSNDISGLSCVISNEIDGVTVNASNFIGGTISFYADDVCVYQCINAYNVGTDRIRLNFLAQTPQHVVIGQAVIYKVITSVAGSITFTNPEFASEGEITATSASVTDLRQAFQIQKWLELANRGGVRYTEFLRAFFGVSPRDDRLQRPEYIGGTKAPVIISEVLQTSATSGEPTPQGYMAGHGLGANRNYIGSYTCREYGLVMGLMSYTTPPVYTQGINRQWLRRTKYDFLFPQFTGLSEQAIEGAEIYAVDNDETENRKVWGYNEVYDELRSMPSRIVGKMRSVFNYWHLARFFSSKPALNEDFVSGKDVSKRIFAVQSEEGLICHYANIIRAIRPLPKYGTPKGV